MTVTPPVYMDNHSTTPVDPRVIEAMLPFFSRQFGNSGSTSHSFGRDAQDAVELARGTIATHLGAASKSIIFTSGATESNNLALRGIAARNRGSAGHVVSMKTEHRAILDPLKRLERLGYEITFVEPQSKGNPDAGMVDPEQVFQAIRDDTKLVTIMLANNEIGVIQPIAQIGEFCRQRGIPLHTDATQAVGRIPVDVEELGVDLLSCSAHKLYGPKGVGALYVRQRLRLGPQIEGGGQERGLRSGTLNVPGIVAFARAIEISAEELVSESQRLRDLRQRLFTGLIDSTPDVELNGPLFDPPHFRLAGNLNCSFAFVDGEALMMSMRDLAVSSGSACTSSNPEPSHVLRALGLRDDLTRASLRFGLGRFNTEPEVDYAIELLAQTVARLRKMSSAVGSRDDA